MRFNRRPLHHLGLPLFGRLVLIGLIWLVLIGWLHHEINGESEHHQLIRMGYMPVVANLAAPIMDQVSRNRSDIRFQAIKFSSFAEMAEALRNDQIQAAFMIAPLSIVLRQQGVDVKVVHIGNRHESTLVTRKALNIESVEQLAGKTVAVPMRFSGHYLAMQQLIDTHLLHGQVKVVEMNPPDMASALSSGSLDAYFVGEPFAAKTLRSGHARLLHYGEDIWPGFICNLTVVKQHLIDGNPEAVRMLVQGAARAGMWASRHPDQAARIASDYWGQDLELVRYALSTPPHRIVFDRFLPKASELQQLADLMLKNGLIASNSIDGLVEDRFAASVAFEEVTALDTVLPVQDNKPE